MNKVYVVWHWSAEDNSKTLVRIYSKHNNETEQQVKERAKKFADEERIAWADEYPDDDYIVEGFETC